MVQEERRCSRAKEGVKGCKRVQEGVRGAGG